MAFERLIQAADALVETLGLRGPEVVDHDNPERHKIGEVDALRYVAKSLRELRHGIALGGQVDKGALDAITDRMATHLGVKGKDGKAAIRAALEAETAAFAKDVIEGTERLGKHAHFHEDHGILDSREFPAEANFAPPPSSPLHHSHFKAHHKPKAPEGKKLEAKK